MAATRGSGQGGTEIVPLTRRVGLVAAFRVVLGLALLALAPASGHRVTTLDAGTVVAWLAVTGLLAVTVLVPVRTLAVRCFGVSLLLDSAFLQTLHALIGHGALTDVAIAADLVAVCLLASFRTGLKIAVWQTVVLVFAVRARETGLPAALSNRPPVPLGPSASAVLEHQVVQDAVMMWLVVLLTAVAAATNERELRRRRYDAEALARFASALHACGTPADVGARTAAFAVEELNAARAVVVRRTRDDVQLLASAGSVAADGRRGTPAGPPDSALLDLVSLHPRRPTLALRLDPARDAWLAGLLPGAFRLVALPWGDAQDDVVLVLDLGRTSRGRAERRVLTAVEQAGAAAGLAWERAELMAAAQLLAAQDGLTGVANRRTFDTRLTELVDEWRAGGDPVALVLLDIDHFKSINDRYGHPVGDEVLQNVARLIAAAAGPRDLPARYGGEEFALVMPGADAITAAGMAEHLRMALHGDDGPLRVTASFGVAALPGDAQDAAALVHAADAALLTAKTGGRDRVVMASALRAPVVPAPSRPRAGEQAR